MHQDPVYAASHCLIRRLECRMIMIGSQWRSAAICLSKVLPEDSWRQPISRSRVPDNFPMLRTFIELNTGSSLFTNAQDTTHRRTAPFLVYHGSTGVDFV